MKRMKMIVTTSTPCTCRSRSTAARMMCEHYGWETAEQTPTDRSLLQRKLAEADLQHGSLQRRPRGKKRKEEEEAKKKRRRVNPKFAKLTNTHLAGTPIGDVLQAALEGRDIEGSATGGARFDVGVGARTSYSASGSHADTGLHDAAVCSASSMYWSASHGVHSDRPSASP